MKASCVFLAGVMMTGMAAGATTVSMNDLAAYYDYSSSTGSGNGTRITPVIAPDGFQYNPVVDYNKWSATGGYNGGGYVTTSTSYYSPSFEKSAGSPLSVSNGFSISVRVRDIGTSGISICTSFTGKGINDASFQISNNTLTTPGFGGWTMAEGRNSITAHTEANYGDSSSIANAPWQSVVISVGSSGIMSIYVDGALFATSNSAWNRMTSGNNLATLEGVRLGGNGNNVSAATDGQYSEFAVWNKALNPEEAEWLSGNGIGQLVPEPATASLGLLGLAALMLRRRRA